MCACGCKNWGAGACVRSYENVFDVRAGADENPPTLKVCSIVKDSNANLGVIFRFLQSSLITKAVCSKI